MKKKRFDISKYIRCGFLLSANIALASCSDNSLPSGYFPLQSGLSWHYEVIRTTPTERKYTAFSIANIGVRTVDGTDYQVRKTDNGNFYYLQKRSDGVVRLARRMITEKKPHFDEPPRFVIKNPLSTGTRWQHKASPYLLDRPQQNDNDWLRREVNYDMNWEIASTSDAVAVKAGRFEQCLRVDGSGTASVARPLSIARDEVLFKISEWYAPGVGLVRLDYREEIDSNQTTGGTIIMELSAFKF